MHKPNGFPELLKTVPDSIRNKRKEEVVSNWDTASFYSVHYIGEKAEAVNTRGGSCASTETVRVREEVVNE